MKRTKFYEMAWREISWARSFELEAVTDLLLHLASNCPQTPIVWEARGCQGRVRYYIGVDRNLINIIQNVFTAHGDIKFAEVPQTARAAVCLAQQLKISRPILTLNTEITEAVTRSCLSALANTQGEEELVLQIVLGNPYSPTPVPKEIQDPYAGFFQTVFGHADSATSEARSAVREKISSHGFYSCIRLGASGNKFTAPGNILNLLSALRTLSTTGVTIQSINEKNENLDYAKIPWKFSLRLSIKEAANLLLLPAGDTELPGVAGLHPRQVMPPNWYKAENPDRTFAVSLDGNTKLSIPPHDSREHTIVLGPIGSGKSTVLENLILADIKANPKRSVLVIDPKADMISSLLSRIPPERDDDVVIIDPSDPCPVGFNPLALKDTYDPGLIADSVLSVFQSVFSENWGIRSQDVLSAALLTLTQVEGSSLLWLPTLLTDIDFRRKITAGITDRIGLQPFWESFENMKESERRQEIAPVLNKIRQFLLRPGLRNVLGQSNPKFNLTELFTKPRIVLVPLNKGLIGAESAKLLGSLLVSLTWVLTLSRAKVPEEQRRLVSVFVDELQDYIAIPGSFSEALAQARGLGVGFTLAHQYREQLPPDIRAGVDSNCRNKIIFGLSASDAKSMAAMAPELEADDFLLLPRYHIYTSFNQAGRNTGWISGKTLSLPKPTRNREWIREKVMKRYGKPGAEVEQEYFDLLEACRPPEPENEPEDDPAPIGRRKKQ